MCRWYRRARMVGASVIATGATAVVATYPFISGDPGSVAVDACVKAINDTTDCEIVKSPEKHPACAFLIPPPPPAPADAATE